MGNGSFKSKFSHRKSKKPVASITSNFTRNCQDDSQTPKSPAAKFGHTHFQHKDGVPYSTSDVIHKAKVDNEMTSTEFYNIVTAETWQGTPQLLEQDYILLIDCRYGSEKPSCCLAVFSDKLLGDKLEHFCLDCSILKFLSKYPFLESCVPRMNFSGKDKDFKTMPSEVIPGLLYQGNAKHATDMDVLSLLGITHIVNITNEHSNKFPEKIHYFKVPVDDRSEEDLLSWLPKTSSFISGAISSTKPKGVILVHCNMGRSRSSAVVLGYLINSRGMSLLEACNLLKDCRPTARPNNGFLEQLLKFEMNVRGSKTAFTDLPF